MNYLKWVESRLKNLLIILLEMSRQCILGNFSIPKDEITQKKKNSRKIQTIH